MSDDGSGVPFPGTPLPRPEWTRTGLKDDGGPFDAGLLFQRSAPLVLDLGCGNGRFLIASAIARPHMDHLGIDLVQASVDWAAHRANERGLDNVRFVTADATEWLFERLGASSTGEIHVYHPQPYYDADAASKRLITPAFLRRAWEVLKPGGLLVLQTDNKPYWDYLRKAVPFLFEPRLHPAVWEDAPQGRTLREIQARRQGLAVFRMEARRLDAPKEGEMPEPDFDANRPRFRASTAPPPAAPAGRGGSPRSRPPRRSRPDRPGPG